MDTVLLVAFVWYCLFHAAWVIYCCGTVAYWEYCQYNNFYKTLYQ